MKLRIYAIKIIPLGNVSPKPKADQQKFPTPSTP